MIVTFAIILQVAMVDLFMFIEEYWLYLTVASLVIIVVRHGYGRGAINFMYRYYDANKMTVSNSHFIRNTAGGHDGAIYVRITELAVTNSY